jgi:hypothetical protein
MRDGDARRCGTGDAGQEMRDRRCGTEMRDTEMREMREMRGDAGQTKQFQCRGTKSVGYFVRPGSSAYPRIKIG